MGGLVSSNKSIGDSEDRRKIRKHEEPIGGRNDEASEAILQGDHLKALRWYHWLIYDMRFRIFYATVISLALGIGVSLLIYEIFNHAPKPNYGSCLTNVEYRFECLINSERPPLEEECYDALCCYVDDETLPFQCHHSFPSGFQYQVSSAVNAPEASQVELTLEPKNSPTLLPLKVKLASIGEDHLEVHFYNPGNAVAEDDDLAGKDLEGGPFLVNYAPAGEPFHLHLQRHENVTLEGSIFDTRLGPVVSTSDSLSFSTVLPSQFFWGLRGGHGDGQETFAVVNGPGSHELPFYMAMEPSGDFHGVFIDTVAPFIFQFIEAPGAMFHFQTKTELKLRFFRGPTPAEVYKQVHKFLKDRRLEEADGDIGNSTSLPPYWALGLHLCRKGLNATATLDELIKLEQGNIPYDSDCIDENMRRPFVVDEEAFPKRGSEFILYHLESLGKRLLLSQKMGLEGTGDGAPLILDRNGVPFVGNSTHGNETVPILYPDYLNADVQPWVTAELGSTLNNYFSAHLRLLSGLVLVDNFPSTNNASQLCPPSPTINTTRIGATFVHLDLICEDAQHTNTNLTKYPEISHLSLHNVFGQESMRVLRTAFETSLPISGVRVPVVGVSTWTGLGIQDGFTGLQGPFSWAGLTDSLHHVLRNFVLNPTLVGTPICGSLVIPKEEITEREEEATDSRNVADDVLCLRWFQLGLLFPFARNRRGLNEIKGPLDLGLQYQRYLISAIRSRYRFIPYYYTRMYESELDAEPLIRPLVFDFYADAADFNATASLLSQFMIGNALMAAPIISGTISREAYFPRGKWYDLHGNLIVDARQGGRTLTVPSVLSEIPVFIQGGHILPTADELNGNSAVETRGNYKILATFPDDPSIPSTGSLYVDDGVSLDSISSGNFNYLSFTGTTQNFRIQASGDCTWTAATGTSTTIQEIKIIGFINPGNVTSVSSVPDIPVLEFVADSVDEETQTLRIFNLSMDWCQQTFNDVTFTWNY